jgi:hypothetical protein
MRGEGRWEEKKLREAEAEKVRRKEGRDRRARVKGENYKGKRQILITIAQSEMRLRYLFCVIAYY